MHSSWWIQYLEVCICVQGRARLTRIPNHTQPRRQPFAWPHTFPYPTSTSVSTSYGLSLIIFGSSPVQPEGLIPGCEHPGSSHSHPSLSGGRSVDEHSPTSPDDSERPKTRIPRAVDSADVRNHVGIFCQFLCLSEYFTCNPGYCFECWVGLSRMYALDWELGSERSTRPRCLVLMQEI